MHRLGIELAGEFDDLGAGHRLRTEGEGPPRFEIFEGQLLIGQIRLRVIGSSQGLQ
jgi:hypothetical protein